MILHLDLEGASLIPGPINTDRWSDKPKEGRLHGAEKNSGISRNKIPPVALLNRMKFPMKPEFFDLNELECRLVAPRLAFQKLMQAPRERQLKIHENV